jgi:hypothetical protein
MENELISKKELLELTGISYGQLYRWKRKNLIPEEWFIKKSAFTGQETFFPRDKILARIEKIMGMKEDVSLDDLATVFSPDTASVVMQKEELLKHNIVSEFALNFFEKNLWEMPQYNFENILFIFITDKALQSGDVNLDEARQILAALTKNYKDFPDNNFLVFLLRKLGVSFVLIVPNSEKIFIEEGVKVILKLELLNCIEELKIKLS